MPLEQARNAKDTDGRCDIYAMGCMLYCMLTGNPPFVGRTIVEVIQAKEVGTYPSARSKNADVPERLDLIISKMTAKLPRYRYQNCTELLQDIESLNLTNKSLHFLEGKLPKRSTGLKADTRIPGTVDVDPDVWYVNIQHADGAATISKLSTAQIKKMLDEGSLKPTARASHLPKEAFRSLATYKEFQGSALSQVSKQAADAQGARFRSLMKKIEEKDREREEQEKSQERKLDPIAKYWHTLWLPSLYVAGGIIVLFFLWYIISGLLK
jgi:serine/threonine-protein kinase